MFGLSADKEKVIIAGLYTQACFLLTFISHIWGVLRRTDLRVVLFERWHVSAHFKLKSSWWLDRITELGVKEADWSLWNVLCIESFPFSTYDKSFLSATVYKFNLKHWINSSKILWRWSNFEIYAWKETSEPGLHWPYAKLQFSSLLEEGFIFLWRYLKSLLKSFPVHHRYKFFKIYYFTKVWNK